MSLKLGVIGAGIAYRTLHLPVLAGMQAVVVWLAGTDRRRLRQSARLTEATGAGSPNIYTDYKQAIASGGVNAILIAVPIFLSETVAYESLKAGVPVMAEKPLAESYVGALSLANAFASARILLMVAENYRYETKFLLARQFVDSGLIGYPRVYFLNDLHFTPSNGIYASTRWRKEGDYKGGYLWDHGIHVVAGLRTMTNTQVRSVHALAASVHPEYLAHQPDTALINIRFDGDMIGHLALGYGVIDRESRRPRIYGDSGTIAITPTSIELWTPTRFEILAAIERRATGYQHEWELFASAVSGDENSVRKVNRDVLEACKDLQVLEAALQSAESGTIVELA